MIKKGFHILVFLFGMLLISQINYAQVDFNKTPDDDLGDNEDKFQELFYEALKQKGIENYDRAAEAFQKCIDVAKHKLYYNGDITSVTGFKKMQERFPSIDHWMIGRGLIADPFLPSMIKNNTLEYPENKIALFIEFHNTLYQQYR